MARQYARLPDRPLGRRALVFALPPKAPLEQRRARVIQRLEELELPHEEYLPLLESLLRLSTCQLTRQPMSSQPVSSDMSVMPHE